MSTSRRQFLSKLGLGAAAAAATGFAGRKLTAAGNEVVEEQAATPVDNRILGDDQFVTHVATNYPPKRSILRIAHKTSEWAREGLVQPGHWFSHKFGVKDCVDLGKTIYIGRIKFAGAKAMRFTKHALGDMPEVVCTDPRSDTFRELIRLGNGPYPGAIGVLYGPVYILTTVNGTQLELFCSNKSMRKFAADELGPDQNGRYQRCGLCVKKCVHSSRGFEWYVPTLKDVPCEV